MRVAVIGAGAAGLVTARELKRAGLEPVVIERQAGVGGTWRFMDPGTEPSQASSHDDPVHSSIYAGLRTNLPTDLMAFSDFPFDERGGGEAGWPRFCGHREVLTYLERFAAHFDLERHIRFGITVTRITPTADAWRLSLAEQAGEDWTEDLDAVAVCNGHYSVPHVPDLPGRFDGAQSHSHTYRRPEPFAGQRVVILGARSSGTDLSREIARVAERVHLCARDHDERRVVGSRANIVEEPAIARLGPGRTLELVDGCRLEDVDHLLFCTGYRYALPFLPPGLVEETGGEWVGPLYLDLVVPSAPTLALVGLPFAVVPFPLVEAQARWWAGALAGQLPMPSPQEMTQQARAQADQLAAAGIPRRHWLRYGERQFAYVDDLARRAGAPPLPPWFAPLYRATREAKRRDPEGYRDAFSER